MNKKVLTIIAIVAVVLLVICGVGGYFVYRAISTNNSLQTISDLGKTINENIDSTNEDTTTNDTTTNPDTNAVNVCEMLTADDAAAILGTPVIGNTISSETSCTYTTDLTKETDAEKSGAITVYVSSSTDAAAADTAFKYTVQTTYENDGTSLNINGATSAFYSNDLEQLIILVGNKYILVSSTQGTYASVQDAAVAVAGKIIEHL